MERRREFLINALYFSVLIGIALVFIKYIAPAFMPFLVGFGISALIDPLVSRLSKRFELKRKPTGILLLLILYSALGMLATLLTVKALAWFGEIMEELPELYSSKIEPVLMLVSNKLDLAADRFYRGFGFGGLSGELDDFLSAVRGSIGSTVSDISVKALSRLSGFAADLSGFMLKGFFTLLSSFLFTLDFERIIKYLRKSLPKGVVDIIGKLRSRLFGTALSYIKSYALIMLITFGELSLGFLIIKIEHPFAAALGISCFDILPILGSGGILIPWSLWKLISGDMRGFVGLLIVWGIISIVRNLIEPRIVGRQVGLHPLATLISMYAGARLFGFFGLFALPVGIALLFSAKSEKKSDQ